MLLQYTPGAGGNRSVRNNWRTMLQAVSRSKTMAKRSTILNQELTHQEIASAAYALFEQSGRIPGRDTENWLQAEAQLLEERRRVAQGESSSRGAAKPSRVLLNRAS
jgi:hypothetical protein